MTTVLAVAPLAMPWPTLDPFLFCVHHDDAYPAGNSRMGPAASLDGRELGMDFAGKDGWRMYHGRVVPGFPQHPHRGFETVTIARRGYIDHSDSLGATARFGRGDCQWMTAGRGIVHCEMFPLVNASGPNPVELFQIWLNLPAAEKLTDPHFKMLWAEGTPVHGLRDHAGREVRVTTYSGALGSSAQPPTPPPKSWAARPESDVHIWAVQLAPGASWVVPAAAAGSQRVVYFFAGDALQIGGQTVQRGHAIQVRADAPVELVAKGAAELLILGGRPIGEPVVQHGPFVMNRQVEIQQAFAEYRKTQFGGWPWPTDDPVHPRDAGRFAKHADGTFDAPPSPIDL